MKKLVCLFLFLVMVTSGLCIDSPTADAGSPLNNLQLTTPVKQLEKVPTTAPVNLPSSTPSINTSAVNTIDIPVDLSKPALELTPINPIIIPGIHSMEKSISLEYPKGGESLKMNQPLVIDLKVKSPGNYGVYWSENSGSSWHYWNCFNTETPALIEFYLVMKSNRFHSTEHLRFKVQSQSNSNIFDETGDITLEAAEWDNSVQATPGNNSVTLKWNPFASAPGRVAYVINRNTAENGQFLPITDFPATDLTYTDNTVINGTTYYYEIAVQMAEYPNCTIYYHKKASARPQGIIVLTVGSPTMLVNGEAREIDPGQGTAPVIVNGRTFVPIRAIIEAMGGTVGWDSANQKITINYKNSTIILQIGSTTATVNGAPKQLDVAPYTSETGRTMLPLRFITENLGCQVDWDWTTQKITIKY